MAAPPFLLFPSHFIIFYRITDGGVFVYPGNSDNAIDDHGQI